MLIVAPGLIDSSGGLAANPELLNETLSGLELSGFADFLSGSEWLPGFAPAANLEVLLCALLQVGHPQGVDPPIGPALYIDEFGREPPPICFAAEPVFLEAGLRDVSLHRAAALALDESEANALLEALAEHFHEDGWEFCRGSSGRWYVFGASDLKVTTHAPMVAPGQRLEDLLPKGPDAPLLHRFLNEAQMLLHNHPVNDGRAATGQRPVNGIWIWGGGPLAGQHLSAWSTVISDLPLATALARHGGAKSQSLPEPTASLNIEVTAGRVLVVDDRAIDLLSDGDLARWRDWLAIFERSILRPAMRALRDRSVEQILLDCGGGRVLSRRTGPTWSWRWGWGRRQRRRRLADFLKGHAP